MASANDILFYEKKNNHPALNLEWIVCGMVSQKGIH